MLFLSRQHRWFCFLFLFRWIVEDCQWMVPGKQRTSLLYQNSLDDGVSRGNVRLIAVRFQSLLVKKTRKTDPFLQENLPSYTHPETFSGLPYYYIRHPNRQYKFAYSQAGHETLSCLFHRDETVQQSSKQSLQKNKCASGYLLRSAFLLLKDSVF